MAQLIQTLFNGIVASGIYLIVALGVTLVFGLTRLINFAHGQLVVLGAFVAATVATLTSFLWGLLAAVVVVGLLSLLMERLVFRFTLANPLSGLIAGLGLMLVGQSAVTTVWGDHPRTVPPLGSGVWQLGPLVISFEQFVALCAAAVMTVALLVVLRHTALGRQMRATQEDVSAAAHVGIKVNRIVATVFVIGGIAAGAAGVTLGTLFPIDPNEGGKFILAGFAVALLGGLGSVQGAVVASFIYGIGETFLSVYWKPEWVGLFTYGLIVAILLVRPGGLFGIHQSDIGGAQPVTRTRRATATRTRRAWLIPIVGIAVAIVFYALQPERALQSALALAACYTIAAYSISLLYDNVGIITLANGGAMAVGAYASALLGEHFELGFWTSLVPAILLAAVFGAIVGIPVSRARGHYMLLLTFAFASLVVMLLNNLKNLTHGDEGVYSLGSPSRIGPLDFSSENGLFALNLAGAIVAAALVWFIARSNFGKRLASIRENEPLAISLGLNVRVHKVLAFAVSGGIAGLSGVLFLYTQGVVVPASFAVLTSVTVVIMVVLGGRGIWGPPVGAVVLMYVPEVLDLSPVAAQLAQGLILVLLVLFLPQGIVPSVTVLWWSVADRQRRPPGSGSGGLPSRAEVTIPAPARDRAVALPAREK